MNVILNLFDAFISETDIPEYALRHSTTPTKGKYEYGKRKERALAMVCAYSLPCAIAAIPSIKPYATTELPQTPVPYNVWRSNHTKGDCVHFYEHDLHFVRLLRDTESMLAELKAARWVITPDFSQHSDMTAEQRMHNSLLNRLMAVWLQELGANIIVNVTWSTPDSFAYCFYGIPTGCAIAINSMGVNKHDVSKYLWRQGYAEAIRRLNPCQILRYGPKMDGELESISTYYGNNHLNRMRNGR